MTFFRKKKERRDEKYEWTEHAGIKMRQYGLSESRVRRVIRHPARVEEGIFEGGIACMQPAGGKKYAEIWAMYVMAPNRKDLRRQTIKVITAWRYPGVSPERDPVPEEILNEVWKLL